MAEKFELVRRGYETNAVDRELRSLTAEVVRLRETNDDLAETVKRLNLRVEELETELSLRDQPSYSALGSKASRLLSEAEEIAIQLKRDAQLEADNLVAATETELARQREEIEGLYRDQLETAERRSAARIAEANIEAQGTVKSAEDRARQLILEAEAEAARTRGQVATEIAAMRTTAKRELEARRAELESDLAAKRFLLAEDAKIDQKAKEHALSKLESQIERRRKEAEEEYLAKHSEAVRQTQEYLEAAQRDITDLKLAARTLRTEVQSLEMETAKVQSKLLQEARAKAEAMLHAAELEAVATSADAQKAAAELVKAAKEELRNLENAVQSSKTYLRNLRSVVADVADLED